MSLHPLALDFLPAQLAIASTECILMVLGEVRDKRLEPLPDLVSDALTEHHGDNIRIGTRAIRQDRGIYHAQAGQAVHAAILVHHRGTFSPPP